LVCNQEGINEASYQWDETDVNFPPIRRDSEDSLRDDFLGEDLSANVGDPHENLETIHRQPVQPDDLQTIHHQPVQPDVQAQANVPADVHNPAANLGAAFAEPARQNATITELTIEDKIRTFHIPDDEPSGPSQTAPLAQNPDKKIAKKTYDAQKSSVTKFINKFRTDSMLTKNDYNDLEQRLFALVKTWV
jgi:hypothetical protein